MIRRPIRGSRGPGGTSPRRGRSRTTTTTTLYKCGGCNQFFVGAVPLVIFMGEGERMLNVELCPSCQWKVTERIRPHENAMNVPDG